MLLDLRAIADRPLFVFGMAAGLIAVKTAAIYAICRAFRMSWRPALGLGLLLSQGGEFGFVLFVAARNAQLVTGEAASLFAAIVTVSMATTPFLMAVTKRFRSEPAKPDEQREGPRDQTARRAGGRLRAVRADRGADADGGRHPGDADRQRRRDDRRRRRVRGQGATSATARGSTCCARPGPPTPS
jgi:hypothetical protein